MNNKKHVALSEFTFYSILISIGAVLIVTAAVIGAWIGRSNTDAAYSRSINYMKQQCISYEDIIISDKVKSLFRLTEQADEISRNFGAYPDKHSDEYLREYAENQRLSAIIITDTELIPEYSFTEEHSTYADWESIIHLQTVSDTMDHPEKIFSERITRGGNVYDITSVARRDARGIVFCCRLQNRNALETYTSSIEQLLAGYETVLDGTLYITDGDTVIGTNRTSHQGLSVSDVPLIAELEKNQGSTELTRIISEGKAYYGGKVSCLDYCLYALYPASNVYNLCYLTTLSAFLIYCILLLFMAVMHSKTRQAHLEELNYQYETVSAVSKMYISIILIDAAQNTFELLGTSELYENAANVSDASQLLSECLPEHVAPDCRDGWRAFADIQTVSSRLSGHEYIEHVYRNTDGVWLRDIITPKSMTQDGTVRSFILVTQNIDDHKRTEIEYQRRLEDALRLESKASSAKTNFLHSMSHDIRTPINVILGMVEIAGRTPEDTKKLSYCREQVRAAAKLLIDIFNDILTINKLDSSDEIPADETPFLLSDVISEVFSVVAALAKAHGVELLKPVVSVTHEYLIGYPTYLRQIIMNLLTNAVRYNRKGGNVSMIFTEEQYDGDRCEIRIVCRDTGIGMSSEFQVHMFEPFAQEDSTPNNPHGGLGLGLSVVKRLVDSMGGRISVNSRINEGTQFDVALPFGIGVPESPKEDDEETVRIDGTRVLLAEDNRLNSEIAEYFLRESGAEVITAENGEEAVAIFERSEPGSIDVILLDVMMPRMNGLDATRAIRRMDRTDADVPILAMTANLFAEDIAECLDAGMNDYISKPIDQRLLIRKIAEYTDGNTTEKGKHL